jgi:outer membrane assembly lipoprotein YfiO
LLFACAVGCSSKDKPEPQPAEIVPKGHTNAVQGTADDIFHNAKHLYYSGLYTVARENFETLRDSYAPGPYAEFGAIKAADAAFEGSEFDQAAQSYSEFVSNYPSSKSKPYAMLRIGRSYQLSQKGLGRDPAGLEKARDAYQKLIEEFPDSTYADAARRYRAEVIEGLGNYEKLVMEFYKDNEKQPAVDARTANYEAKWAPLLNDAIADANPHAAPEGEVIKTVALSDRSFPILAAQRSSTIRARIALGPDAAVKRTAVQDFTCTGNIVTIRLSGPAPEGLDGTVLAPVNDRVSLSLAGMASEASAQNCFAKSDLRFDGKGALSLESTRAARVMTLNNPWRLLLVLQ